MSDNNIYNSSSFFETIEGEINAQFTGFTDEHSPLPWMCVKGVTRFGQRWRVKGVDAAYSDAATARQWLDREFEQGVTLWHPGISRMIARQDVPTIDGGCIIEEWVEGTPLLEAEHSDGESLARQLVDAVSYYMGKGVVHGNLASAGSIVVNESNRSVKIRDFDPRAKDARADYRALAVILAQLLPQRKYRSLIKRCANCDYTTGSELKRDFERAAAKRPWRTAALIACAVLALAAVGVTFILGRQRQKADAQLLPPGYTVDSVAPPGTIAVYSTVTQSDIYLLPFDSVTPVPPMHGLAVDLGLSVKWSKVNMGCTRATVNTVGKYYGWGDTADHSVWRQGGLDEYWPADKPLPAGISGTDLDAAHKLWGQRWRIPTRDQWEELVKKCKWRYRAADDGAAGYVVTGPNGNSIFLPMAGWSNDGINIDNAGRFGYYWTANTSGDGHRNAGYILLDQRNIITDNVEAINTMMSLRPVTD